MPFTFTSAEHSIEGCMEHAAIAGCVDAVLVELRTNDAFLNHFRTFAHELRREHPLDAHQVRSLLGAGAETDKILTYEKDLGIASFFLEFRSRLAKDYASALSNEVLHELLDDEAYRRPTPGHLKLKLAEEMSSGLEVVKKKVVVLRAAQELSEGRSSLPTGVPKLK